MGRLNYRYDLFIWGCIAIPFWVKLNNALRHMIAWFMESSRGLGLCWKAPERHGEMTEGQVARLYCFPALRYIEIIMMFINTLVVRILF
jgi:hypothetical protein